MTCTVHDACRAALLLLALVLLSAGQAQCQSPVLPMTPGNHQVVVGLALEPELLVRLGYATRVGAVAAAEGMWMGGEVVLPPYLVRRGAGRVNLSATGLWRSASRWGTTLSAQLYAARARNRAGTLNGMGVEVRAAPGVYGARGSLAADVGWQETFFTHVRHGEAAREAFRERYPQGDVPSGGPRDGWYGHTARRFRVGVAGSRVLAGRTDLRLALGALFVQQNQGVLLGFDLGQIPFYAETALRTGW